MHRRWALATRSRAALRTWRAEVVLGDDERTFQTDSSCNRLCADIWGIKELVCVLNTGHGSSL